jgi:hypothetical protein
MSSVKKRNGAFVFKKYIDQDNEFDHCEVETRLEADSHINHIVEGFKHFLIGTGFIPETVNKIYFSDEDEDEDKVLHLNEYE